MASLLRPPVAESATVIGIDGKPFSGPTANGLKEWNNKLGLIHLSRPLKWTSPLPKVGEVVPDWLRRLGDLSNTQPTTIMWSNPHTTVMPNHLYYFEKGFYQLPDKKWLIFSLRDGKRFQCKFWPLEKPNHEIFSQIGSLDVMAYFQPLVRGVHADSVVFGSSSGQPQTVTSEGQNGSGSHSGSLIHSPSTTSRPYQQLTWQQPNVPAAFEQSGPHADMKTAGNEHIKKFDELLLPMFKERATDYAIDILSLVDAHMKQDHKTNGVLNAEHDPVSANLAQQPSSTTGHALPADQIPGSQLAEVTEGQHLTQGTPSHRSSGRTESDSSNKTIKAISAADTSVIQDSGLSTASAQANREKRTEEGGSDPGDMQVDDNHHVKALKIDGRDECHGPCSNPSKPNPGEAEKHREKSSQTGTSLTQKQPSTTPAISSEATTVLSGSQASQFPRLSRTMRPSGETPAVAPQGTSFADSSTPHQATHTPTPGQMKFEDNKPRKPSQEEMRCVIDALRQHSPVNLPLALHPYYNWGARQIQCEITGRECCIAACGTETSSASPLTSTKPSSQAPSLAGADAMQWVSPSKEHYQEGTDEDQTTLKGKNRLSSAGSKQYASVQNERIQDIEAPARIQTLTKQPSIPNAINHLPPRSMDPSSSSSKDQKNSIMSSHHPIDRVSDATETTHQQALGSHGPGAIVDRDKQRTEQDVEIAKAKHPEGIYETAEGTALAPTSTALLENDDDDFWDKFSADGPSLLDFESEEPFPHGQYVSQPDTSGYMREGVEETSQEGN
ncbi:MAG: hypothetical protein Q9213_002485 [Squamulea squamosa]